MRTPRNLFLLIVSIVSLSPFLSASDSLYFARIYDEINQNISEGNFEQNFENIERLVQEEEFRGLGCYEKGKVFHKIGLSYYLVDQEDEAIRLFKDSVLTIWENCLDVPRVEKAKTTFNIGICYRYLREPERAKEYLDEALTIFENDPDYPPYELARKFQGLGDFYRDYHDSFRTELYYENALNLYEGIEGTEGKQFSILNNLLIMSLDFKKYDKSKEYYERAYKLYKKNEGAIGSLKLSMIQQNVGIAYWELKEFDAAAESSKAALELIEKEETPLYYTNAIELAAMVEGDKKNFEKAFPMLQEVIDIRSQNLSNSDSKLHLGSAYENMGDLHRKKGDLAMADSFYFQAFKTVVIKGSYAEDNTPVVDSNLVVIDEMQIMRLCSLKTEVLKKKFLLEKDQTYLEKSLALHFKIDTLINKNLLSMQFQGSKLNFLELILKYYGSAIKDALLLHKLSGDAKYLHTAYYFSSKTKAIILQNELKNSDALRSLALSGTASKGKETGSGTIRHS